MSEEMDIILRAVDEASDTFESVASAAENMGESLTDSADTGSQGFEQVEEAAEGAVDPMEQITTLVGGLAGVEIFQGLADTLWDFADKAGTFEDSLMRARLEAEGAGISVDDMTDAVSELSATTGRAGGEIRESFIRATARGITDLDSFKQMMEGAGAQATLLGTDIQTMADKFSGFASRSRIMEKALANTGITVEELGEALGIQGATIDEVNAKWETMTEDQRAAALGMAATMNEGQTANEEYKKSWAGLHEQIEIAKGRIERLVGEVLLPVLIPALQIAARVLQGLGDVISAVMDGPFGGLISIVGSAAAAFALAVPAYMALNGAISLLTATAIPAATALWGMVAPLLPFIAVGAAVVLLVYEIGKAFGWWTDVSTMVDAIWAGIQRLWSAFINHPDVQGFLSAMGSAWNAILPFIQSAFSLVMSFFNNANSSGRFDIVRALIDGIGAAWQALTFPIRLVITVVKLLWTTVKTAGNNIKKTINSIHTAFTRLPGLIRSAISTIAGILLAPFSSGYKKIAEVVGDIISKAKSIANIDISGLTKKLTAPFSKAYNDIVGWAKKTYNDAQKWYNSITASPHATGGEEGFFATGGEISASTGYNANESLKVDMNQNLNLSLDLRNVPNGIDQDLLHGVVVETLTSKEVLESIAQSNEFQSMDSKVKSRILAKGNRARGVM